MIAGLGINDHAYPHSIPRCVLCTASRSLNARRDQPHLKPSQHKRQRHDRLNSRYIVNVFTTITALLFPYSPHLCGRRRSSLSDRRPCILFDIFGVISGYLFLMYYALFLQLFVTIT